jgi:membrane protein
MPEHVKPDSRKSAAREVFFQLRRFAGLRFGDIVALFRDAASEWVDDKAPRLGASLAYYTLLSLAPLLVVAVGVAALAFGKKAVEGQLFWQIQSLLGRDGAIAVQGMIRNADQLGTGLLATVIGVLILLFAASSVVIELEDALNTIRHIPAPASSGKWGGLIALLKDRLYSVAMVLGTGLLLLISLLVNTVISLLGSFFGSVLPVSERVLRLVEFVVGFCVTTMLFAAIYKFIPAVRLKWSDVFIGACVTSLLFTIGKQLIGIYLGKASFASTYGAAGSLVAVLVWVYYSAQLFFLGAEFTKVYTRRFGSMRVTSN